MQEEVENKVVIVMTNCSKLTARELKQAMSKVLAAWKQRKAVHKQKQAAKEAEPAHGKMTVKELAAKDKGMQSIEVNDSNIGSFNRIARKYGIDFAPYKVKGEKKYLVSMQFMTGPMTPLHTSARMPAFVSLSEPLQNFSADWSCRL